MSDLRATGLCLHGFRRGECIADLACTYAVPGRWRAEHPTTVMSTTPTGRRLLEREMWEWLPESYQMSRVRLIDDVLAIEAEAASEAAPVVGLDVSALRRAIFVEVGAIESASAERIAAEYARLTQTRTLGTDGAE